MLFEGAGYSNVGRTRESNQDSYLIKVASTPVGDVALVAVADGMGGLECGELASAAVINMLSDWFDNKLPVALEAMESSVGGFESFVDGQWGGLIQDMNMALIRYGMAEHMNLGTTLTAMLAIGGRYSIVHVGDTRAYELTESATNQLTVDQTFVRREVEAGRITPEEALTHPRRNVLLQCLGSTKEVVPDLIHGNLDRDAIYLLCSDGFRHVLTDTELRRRLGPDALDANAWDAERRRGAYAACTAADLDREEQEGFEPGCVTQRIADMAKLVMDRKEADNVTALVLRVQAQGGR